MRSGVRLSDELLLAAFVISFLLCKDRAPQNECEAELNKPGARGLVRSATGFATGQIRAASVPDL